MGAVTARQRESIPAGTGTTDLPRETVHQRGAETRMEREREKEREEGGREGATKRERERGRRKPPSRRRESREKGREGKEKRAVSRERSKRWRRMTDGEEQGLAHRCVPGCKSMRYLLRFLLFLSFLPRICVQKNVRRKQEKFESWRISGRLDEKKDEKVFL